MKKLDIDIKLPRTTKKQRNRANTPANSPEQYYLRTLFILPLIIINDTANWKYILEDLRERLLNKKNECSFLLIQIIPSYILKLSNKTLESIIETVIK